jgi:hypothetical protein
MRGVSTQILVDEQHTFLNVTLGYGSEVSYLAWQGLWLSLAPHFFVSRPGVRDFFRNQDRKIERFVNRFLRHGRK